MLIAALCNKGLLDSGQKEHFGFLKVRGWLDKKFVWKTYTCMRYTGGR